MKKGKIIVTVTIGLAFFILSAIIFMQFKVVYETDITSIEAMQESQLRTELASWKEKYAKIEEEYNAVQETLRTYKEETTNDAEAKEALEKELNNLKLMLGKTDVQGEGIIIKLDDRENCDNPITSEDLLVIVNSLVDAGAEAIAINDKRIVNMSDMADVSSSIRINSKRISSPYEIKAIGNQTYLESALFGNDGYIKTLQADNIQVSLDKSKKVIITKYDEDFNNRYIESEE